MGNIKIHNTKEDTKDIQRERQEKRARILHTKLKASLQMAQLRAEKCELKEANKTYLSVLKEAKKADDMKLTMEALSGLLRLSGEFLDEESIQKWDQELEELMASHPGHIPPMAWYCKGAIARHRRQFMLAQCCFHRFLRIVKADGQSEELIAKGWIMLAICMQQRHRLRRSLWLAQQIITHYESKNLRGINGTVYLLMATLLENQKDYKTALVWFHKAHAQFLGDHNWYYHLYALYGYARIARHQHNFSQAYWYLDLIEKATASPEFGFLRRTIQGEKNLLQQDAVDLLIDGRKGLIKTREQSAVSMGKQHVLFHILEALTLAHKKQGSDLERGLSKAEIIESVWKEPYLPEVHDNKLYYNINRIRKLIEPNIRKPQYLLNWKKGYRLAPSMRVRLVGGFTINTEGDSK